MHDRVEKEAIILIISGGECPIIKLRRNAIDEVDTKHAVDLHIKSAPTPKASDLAAGSSVHLTVRAGGEVDEPRRLVDEPPA